MKGFKSFLVLRYSLIENKQGTLVSKALPNPKGAAVVSALQDDGREFLRNKVRYSFVGFSFVEPVADEFPRGRFLLGKTAKHKITKVGDKIPGDIISHDADDWVPVITIVDIVDQYIFVHHDWRFGTEEQIANAVHAGLKGPILDEYNYSIFIEPKTIRGEFWNIVRSHKKIYEVELDLISPNILETNVKARDALKAMKELFGQEEVKVTLSNEYGDLKVPKNPIEDYLDYIEEGEGKWSVTTEGEYSPKKTHKSSSAIVRIDLDVPSAEVVLQEAQLELETGEPAPGRAGNDARIVADVFSVIGQTLRR
ncbi:hypothetical protein SAMN05216598_5198 [Pseudomonas asplenii]|uniref:Uncharacterized protein n=1 Tax=Pseudomonas asplenii TaxID=53407 RepID=A0A1H1ZNG8_9PSED|nr:hypothetical protein [Pseudomonas asplenii]SDT35193.1 hypothetical protein SAMN05216598_5198 [Pseudomonas asplenii]